MQTQNDEELKSNTGMDEPDDTETPENKYEASSLTRLSHACTSITRRSLSCRTLGHGNPIIHTTVENDELSHEVRIGEWLDRRLFDARATLLARQRRTASAAPSGKTRSKSRQQLQDDLVDESIRKQQENLLWQRLNMASIAMHASGLVTTTDSPIYNDDPQALLVREAVKARDALVQTNLHALRRLECLQQKQSEMQNQCLTLQQQNRQQWGALQVVKEASEEGMRRSPPGANQLDTETRILKRVVQDILLASDLDWYVDPRLRDTILRLEC